MSTVDVKFATEGAYEYNEDVAVPKGHVVDSTYVPSLEDERKLRRKLDFTILPWIMLMYFLSYMDR
jgi:hypothetical protein